MNILVSSYSFYPNIGGIEIHSKILCEELSSLGYSVKLVTFTSKDGAVEDQAYNFKIIRKPTFRELISLVQWADIYFQENVSLRLSWPLLFIKRPWVAIHHIWLRRTDGRRGLRDVIKRGLLKYAINIYVSKELKDDTKVEGIVIPNFYDNHIFKLIPNISREKDVLFVGRLIYDKGLDILLHALKVSLDNKEPFYLTVVGEGRDGEYFRKLTYDLGLDTYVTFLGKIIGEELAKIYNEHKIVVLPSRWQEPYGIVVLEAMACGCVVIGSKVGGMASLIESRGILIPKGDYFSLYSAIRYLKNNSQERESFQQKGYLFVKDYTREKIIPEYVKILDNIYGNNK